MCIRDRFASAVQYVTSNSLMNGTSTTAFSPSANMSRGMLMTVLARYAGEPDGAADLSAYADAGSVSAYAEKAVQWCVKNGILTGKASSTLAPKATATRAECAAMLQRFAAL